MNLLEDIAKLIESDQSWRSIIEVCNIRNLTRKSHSYKGFVQSITWQVVKEFLIAQNGFKFVNEIEKKYDFVPVSLAVIVSQRYNLDLIPPSRCDYRQMPDGCMLDDIANQVKNSKLFRELLPSPTNELFQNKDFCFQFVKSFTWWIWKEILLFKNNHQFIAEIEKEHDFIDLNSEEIVTYLSEQQVKFSQPDILHEICTRVYEWRALARVFEFKETVIEKIHRDVFESKGRNTECKDMSRKVIAGFNAPSFFKKLWSFWRVILNEFENGRKIINELQKENLSLMMQTGNSTCHYTIKGKRCFVGHYYHTEKNSKYFIDEKECQNIRVNIGSTLVETVEYQNFNKWLTTQERYFKVYKMFEDLKAINLCNIDDPCSILQCFQSFLTESQDDGFIVKGYSMKNHLKKFNNIAFPCKENSNDYLAYIANSNVILHLYKCTNPSQFCKIFHDSLINFQIADILHEFLHESNVIHINVIICDNNEVEEVFSCSECVVKKLFVDQETFTNIDRFKGWYNSVIKSIHVLTKQMSSSALNQSKVSDVAIRLKQNIIGYQALTTYTFPTFTELSDIQMGELKKLVFLTPTQFKLLHSNNKHVIIKGGYGSGKTLILQKKFEEVVENSNENEACCFICYDQQSKLSKEIERIKTRHPDKNVLICNSYELVKNSLSLHNILIFLSSTFKGKTVHVIMDEYFYKAEEKLTEVLGDFEKSFIFIGVHSMVKRLYFGTKNIANTANKVSIEEILSEDADFLCCTLEYALRCSSIINQFVNASITFLESLHEFHGYLKGFYPEEVVEDDEYQHDSLSYIGILSEKYNKCYTYTYNNPSDAGHDVDSSLINIYYIDEKIEDRVDSICQLLMFLLNQKKYGYMFEESARYVVTTYDSNLYYSVKNFLAVASVSWTDNVEAFCKPISDFKILLTDYASIRGLEFENVIVLLTPHQQLLKYRFIEMFTRATTNLYIIVDELLKHDYNAEFFHDERFSNQSVLFKEWKSLDFVSIIDCKYNKEDFTYILESSNVNSKVILPKARTKGEAIELVPFLGFQWTNPWYSPAFVSLKNREEMQIIIKLDNVECFVEMINLHKLSLHDNNNPTLHIAAFYGSLNIVKYLICEEQIPVDKLDDKRKTPLSFAVSKEQYKVVNYLLSKNADPTSIDMNTKTPLFRAVRSNNVEVMKLFLEKITDVNMEYLNGDILLHLAVINDSFDVANMLLEKGADPNLKNAQGWCPLQFVLDKDYFKLTKEFSIKGANHLNTNHREVTIYDNNINTVKRLIDNGFVVNMEPGGNLLLSVPEKRVKMVKLLIDKGADINTVDQNNRTLLHFAIQKNNVDLIESLIEKGADINSADINKSTPLHYAVRENNHDVAKLLIEKGVDINAVAMDNFTPLHAAVRINNLDIAKLLIEKGADINAVDMDKFNPLLVAVNENNLDITKLLIDKGANINTVDAADRNPLHHAVRINRLDIAKLLIEKGADINALELTITTPLHYAVDRYNLDISNLLIEKGADINAVQMHNFTPLHLAAHENRLDIAKVLIENGADVNAAEVDDFAPLHYAFRGKNLDIAKLLLEKGADIYAVDIYLFTPVHLAVNENKLDIVKLLIDKGVDINTVDAAHRTPLHHAVRKNRLDIAKLLIEKGADINAVEITHSTPLHYAVHENNLDIGKLLIENGANINAIDINIFTPVRLAVNENKLDIAKLLIESKYDVTM